MNRAPQHVVVMGVSGSGKSTIAAALARSWDRPLCEGDDLHPQVNRRKLAQGQPLADADREPWLIAVRDWMTRAAEAGEATVVTCSALRRSYRDVLRQARGQVWFVHVDPPRETTRQRIGHRLGHFMPASLLESQWETLEPLGADEEGVVIDGLGSPDDVAAEALRRVEELFVGPR